MPHPIVLTGGYSPTVQSNFAQALGDFTTLSTLSTMPTGGSISRAGQAMYYDSTGKLTYAPNNLLLNTATLSTQSVTTSAINYILSFSGTGSVALSGTYSGTLAGTGVSNRVYLAFTATAGTLTATVTGSVTSAQLEAVTYQTTPSTYVATTAAAYYGPRFDTNPATLAAKGLLIEGTRTNLLTYSEQFDNAAWTNGGGVTVTANTDISPDGTQTADTLVFSGASQYIRTNATSSVSGLVVTGTLYIKGTSGETIQVAVGGVDQLFTLNGSWQRLVSTKTSSISTVGAFNINTYGGSTARTIKVWGAQLEAGAFATSYIPTVAASVTRAAETFAITGYSTNLINATYIDEQTGVTSTQPYNAGVNPSPAYSWLTSLRVYTNAYAGSIASPSWLSFSRASNATMTDSTGAITWAPTNILLNSQNFASTWTLSNVTVSSGATTAPDGTLTADKLIEAATNSVHRVRQGISVVAQSYVLSVYAKKAERDRIWFGVSDTVIAAFDLSNGTVVTGSNAGILNAGNGWYRCSLLVTTLTASGPYIGLISTGTTNSYLGDITKGVYVWGAQLEAVTYQTYPAAYVATTSSAYYGPRYDYDASTVPATPRGLLIEETRTNVALYSNDFTNAAWVKSNTTDITAAKDQTGVDGVANGASSLLCAVANGTVLQSITLASSARYQTCYVKRLIGTGTISMTMDGGSTWVDVTSQISTAWARVSIASQTVTNPQVGFKMATQNDKIAVQYFQNENGAFSTSAIPTTSASVQRTADVAQLTGSALTVAGANIGSAIVQTTLWENSTAAARDLIASSTSRRLLYSNSSNTVLSSTDGSTGLNATIGGSGTFTGGSVRSAIAWNASGRSLVANNGTVTSDAVNLSTGASATLGGYSTTTTFDGWVASMALYNQKLPDTVLKTKSVVGSPY